MAIAYSELGKYSEAIKALNTASNYTKTSDEKYIVSYNLALVYTNWNKLDICPSCILLHIPGLL